MQTNIKIFNRKELWLKALVNSGCTHIGIDKKIGERRKDQDGTNKQVIQDFQYRQNQEQRSYMIFTTETRN